MNVYGSRIWCYNGYKSIIKFYVAFRKKTIRRSRHFDKSTHTSLPHTINNNLPSDLLLEQDVFNLSGIYLTVLMSCINFITRSHRL